MSYTNKEFVYKEENFVLLAEQSNDFMEFIKSHTKSIQNIQSKDVLVNLITCSKNKLLEKDEDAFINLLAEKVKALFMYEDLIFLLPLVSDSLKMKLALLMKESITDIEQLWSVLETFKYSSLKLSCKNKLMESREELFELESSTDSQFVNFFAISSENGFTSFIEKNHKRIHLMHDIGEIIRFIMISVSRNFSLDENLKFEAYIRHTFSRAFIEIFNFDDLLVLIKQINKSQVDYYNTKAQLQTIAYNWLLLMTHLITDEEELVAILNVFNMEHSHSEDDFQLILEKVEKRWTHEEYIYREDNFVEIVKKMNPKNILHFLHAHKKSIQNMLSAQTLTSLYMEARKKIEYTEKKQLLTVFEEQFKAIFNFQDLLNLLSMIKNDEELKFNLVLIMQDLLNKPPQLAILLGQFSRNHPNKQKCNNTVLELRAKEFQSATYTDEELVDFFVSFKDDYDFEQFMGDNVDRINKMTSAKEIIRFILCTHAVAHDGNNFSNFRKPMLSDFIKRKFSAHFARILNYSDVKELIKGFLEIRDAYLQKYHYNSQNLAYCREMSEWLSLMVHVIHSEARIVEIYAICAGKVNIDAIVKKAEENMLNQANCFVAFRAGQLDEGAISYSFFRELGDDTKTLSQEIFRLKTESEALGPKC